MIIRAILSFFCFTANELTITRKAFAGLLLFLGCGISASGQSSIPADLTIDFNSSGFVENKDHGSDTFTQGDITIKYSGGHWYEDTGNGEGGTAGLFAGFYSGSPETVTLQTTSGNEFDLSSFYFAQFGDNITNVKGYRDLNLVANKSVSAGAGTKILGSDFYNVDKVIITSGSSGYFDIFDTFVLKKATTTLPVHLRDFRAESNNQKISLNWQTISEKNNKQFILSRSEDGITFTELARITGAENSFKTENYKYDDLTPLKGNNYYKLQQVDNNGTITNYAIITAKFSLEDSNTIKVYPNPIVDCTTLSFNPGIYRNLYLLNLNGQEFLKSSINTDDNSIKLNLSGYSPGVYIVKLEDKNNGIEVCKLIKQ